MTKTFEHVCLAALAAIITACAGDEPTGTPFLTIDSGAASTSTSTTTTGTTGAPDTTGGGSSSSDAGSGGSNGTTSTTEQGSGTSGPPPPAHYCGDGVVDAPDEECDDMNDDPKDGCYACLRARTVFATSVQFRSDLGGLDGADSMCRQFANKAGLARWVTFKAWLSDSTTNAVDRLYLGPGIYVRVDGGIVADTGKEFLSGTLEQAIGLDEYGQEVKDSAWTGTRPDGTAVPGATHCGDWTSNDFLDKGYYGITFIRDNRWTLDDTPETNPTPCGDKLRLYCLEGE